MTIILFDKFDDICDNNYEQSMKQFSFPKSFYKHNSETFILVLEVKIQ